MKNFIKSILNKWALILLITISFSSLADDRIMQNSIDWIVKHSDLEYNDEQLPVVKRVSNQELALRYYDLDPQMPEQDIPRKVQNLELYGLYDFHSNTLYLPQDKPVWSWPYRYIIVHEMVHFLQQVNGKFDGRSCVSTLEPEAYEIMGRWQDYHNHDSPRANAFIVHIMANACSEYQYQNLDK